MTAQHGTTVALARLAIRLDALATEALSIRQGLAEAQGIGHERPAQRASLTGWLRRMTGATA